MFHCFVIVIKIEIDNDASQQCLPFTLQLVHPSFQYCLIQVITERIKAIDVY